MSKEIAKQKREVKHKLCKIRGATDKETMWMLMRDKPTRYHNDNDTNNMKDISLFAQTQRTHAFLEHSCKATPLRGFERRFVIGERTGGW